MFRYSRCKSSPQERYLVKAKAFRTVIQQLTQHVSAEVGKLSRYRKKMDEYQQNRLFNTQQKKCYNQINREERSTEIEKLNAEES